MNILLGILLRPFLGFMLDRKNTAEHGNFLVILVYLALGMVGMVWQMSYLRDWREAEAIAVVRTA